MSIYTYFDYVAESIGVIRRIFTISNQPSILLQ